MAVAGWVLDALYEPQAGLSVTFPKWLSGPTATGARRILPAGFSVALAWLAAVGATPRRVRIHDDQPTQGGGIWAIFAVAGRAAPTVAQFAV